MVWNSRGSFNFACPNVRTSYAICPNRVDEMEAVIQPLQKGLPKPSKIRVSYTSMMSSAYSSAVFVSNWEFLKNTSAKSAILRSQQTLIPDAVLPGYFDSGTENTTCPPCREYLHESLAFHIITSSPMFTHPLSAQTHLGKRQLRSPSRTQWTAGMAEPLSKSDPKPLWSNLMEMCDQLNQLYDNQTRKVNQLLSQRPFLLWWVLCLYTCICWDMLGQTIFDLSRAQPAPFGQSSCETAYCQA